MLLTRFFGELATEPHSLRYRFEIEAIDATSNVFGVDFDECK
jgi:hypothetical protein